MKRPPDHVIDEVAPPIEIDGLTISDGHSTRNVAHAEQLNTLRLPRHGSHDATLVVAKKFYDGSSGGEAGHYALCYVEFKAASSRWRTAGVKIRAEEATRIARALGKPFKPSKPGRNEDARVGGKVVATEESELRGTPVPGGYVIYVRHKMRSGAWGRTRGVEILDIEAPSVAATLKTLAEKV